MKVIQINVQEFKYYDALEKYLEKQNADIMFMQEAWSWSFWSWIQNACKKLASHLWYELCFAKCIELLWDEESYRGNCIMSKYPIVDVTKEYLPEFWDKCVRDVKKDLAKWDPTILHERSQRRLYWQDVPFPLLSCVMDTPQWYIRAATVHFPASPRCEETYLMNMCSNFICNRLKEKKSLPMILSWDFNIHAHAWCIDTIKNLYEQVNTTHTNTLNKSVHPWFKNDIPDSGYMVDHVFVTWLKVNNWRVDTVNISDHYPIIATLDMETA